MKPELKPPTKDSLPLFCRAVVELSPLSMAAAEGKEHILRYVNPSFCNLAGKQREDLIGRPIAQIELIAGNCMSNLDRVFSTGKGETCYAKANRGPDVRYWSYNIWPIIDSIKQPLGIMILVADETKTATELQHSAEMNQELIFSAVRQGELIEGQEKLNIALQSQIGERKRKEKELKKLTIDLKAANREMESFSYSVSHDLRAPLRAIDGFSAMLMKSVADKLDPDEKRKLSVIRENSQKMDRLINDLLAFSRLGRAAMSWNKVDMKELANQVWQEQVNAHPNQDLKVKWDNLPEALGNRDLIRQVLSNLVANAVKFSKRKKTAQIEIGGQTDGTENLYYVKDNGAGFDMRYYDKLFGVFQRLHSESEYEGTGVGLAIVERIIHRHGGRVWAEGKVGKGAVFYFTLPREREGE